MKIGDKLETLRRTYPLLDPQTLAMARRASDFTRSHKSIAVYFILESAERTYTLHSTIFTKRRGRRLRAWRAWLDKHFEDILASSILPGLILRSGQQWRMVKLVGFAPSHVVQ